MWFGRTRLESGPGLNPDAAIVIGPGRLGLSLAGALAKHGRMRRVAVVGHGPERPGFLTSHDAVEYESAATCHALWAESPATPLGLVFAVDDDGLAAAAAEWAKRLADHSVSGPLVALHTSGFHTAAVLEPLDRIEGASIGGWHPLIAVAQPDADVFEGVTVGIEGEPAAVTWADEISRALGALPVPIPAGEKARYHAAAVFASNYLVASLGVALAELEAVSGGAVDESALLPLARAAIDNVAEHGISAGATGPLVRGDVHTVTGHLAALDPARASLYRALGRELLDLVRQRNSPEVYAALRAALSED